MGSNKAFLQIDSQPLWRRQLQVLRALEPNELFVAGGNWDESSFPDAPPDIGPLGGLVAALQHCSSPLLLVLAVDLPRMTSDYLCRLLALCAHDKGAAPASQPLAAVYPIAALEIAQQAVQSADYSMQRFVARCASRSLVSVIEIAPVDESLFLNLNTPQDLDLVAAVYDRRRGELPPAHSVVTHRRYR